MRTLDGFDLVALGAMAFGDAPWSRTRLTRCLAAAGFGADGRGRGRALQPEDLEPRLHRWQTEGWVVQEGGGQWRMTRLSAPSFRIAAADPSADVLEHVATTALVEPYYDDDTIRLRLALYQDRDDFEARLRDSAGALRGRALGERLLEVVPPDTVPSELTRLPAELQKTWAQALGRDEDWILGWAPMPNPALLPTLEAIDPDLGACLALLAGREPKTDRPLGLEAEAFRRLVEGDVEGSRACLREAVDAAGRRKRKLSSFLGPTLALVLATGEADDRARARAHLEGTRRKKRLDIAYMGVDLLLRGKPLPPGAVDLSQGWQHALTGLAVADWSSLRAQDIGRTVSSLADFANHLNALGFAWPAGQLHAIAKGLVDSPSESRQLELRSPEDGASRMPQFILSSLVQQKPDWVRSLEAIESLLAAPEPPREASDERLVWSIDVDVGWRAQAAKVGQAPLGMEPRLKKRARQGWTKGRVVALSTLAKELESSPPWLTDHDRAVIGAIRVDRGWGGDRFYLSTPAVEALVGHPHVEWSADGRPAEVVRGEPKVSLAATDGGYELSLQPSPPDPAIEVWPVREGDRLVVHRFDETSRTLRSLARDGVLRVPREGRARLEALAGRLAGRFTLESDLMSDEAEGPLVEADPRPVLQLKRRGDALLGRVRVFPLGLDGPEHRAGQGRIGLHATIEGEPVRCRRDLELERGLLEVLLDRCPELPGEVVAEGAEIDLETGLDVLARVADLEDVQIAWPEGKPLRLDPTERGMPITLREAAGEWFEAEGELRVDESLVVSLAALLEAMGRRRGRYVPLEGDRFIALTASLERSLLLLGAGGRQQDESVKLPSIAAQVMAAEGRDLKLDAKAKRRLDRARKAAKLEPEIPPTLETELRSYQQDGFRWMMRLAHWGAGACLADDMGLGKTVQALAVLVARAGEGPALVVAPSSVTLNWHDEAARFAPTLRPLELDASLGLEELGPYDLVITSYAQLTRQADALARVKWATALLDEAQAIKNPSTQRAKAAFGLDARFRVVTTGTPVENHVGELWSLMRFLNPTLLGPRARFEERFGRPIAAGAKAPLEQLQRLVSPFVLRRTKRQVLRELPSKTEIVELVEPSEAERAFSEALRRRAVERLKGAGEEASVVAVLSELTRLRQAACATRLVDENLDLGSSKLDRLMELLEELLDGGHRALVFSQFTQFLALARERLEAAGISFQYLDGSTSKKARRRAMDAFQAGEGAVFLISLKAGGSGLNLTGADYVIHLDPWWNPAAEDQASDRAHRIGQTRPVTVIRLVTAKSIEQKVVALHATKRDLAERLLEGTAKPRAPELEVLVGLLRED